MSVAQGVNERLAALTEAGVSIWLDQIRRSLIDSGELERMAREDSLRGVTANPSIFEKAILGSPDYDEELAELARQNWELIGRPNAMIKIPGTEEGIPAIEQATFEGINVNVTLLFAVEMYEKAAEAFIRGLERRRDEGRTIDDVHSVASFFVSRVDTEADKRLEALGNTELQGTAALANARAAYIRFKDMFYGERFAALRDAGAPVQRALWASTGTKNPRYSDT